ncbi:hypothetical protein C8J57DRAFT_1354518 [Mycena rebaudengoi]|nr:hypothetical protein C8J57DRAFT_1354518 [Mycena rebaudengoi]
MNSTIPPTTHSLPEKQRLRMMRSTRKLTALLGTAPLLVDPLEPMPQPSPGFEKGHKRVSSNVSAFSCDPSSPPATLVPAASPADSSCSIRPTLLLRIPTSNSRSRRQSQGCGRPEDADLPSPDSPAQRKMMRVARTFGEQVPAELVFRPVEHPTSSSPAELENELVETYNQSSAQSVSSYMEGASYTSSVTSEHERSSESSYGRPSSVPERTRKPSVSSDRAWVPSTIRRFSSQRLKGTGKGLSRRASVTKRAETGWTGEWNREDMDDVMKR